MKSAPELIPTPDPTVLTTQALLREISTLKELLEVSSRVTDVRLQAMDKAIVLLQEFTDRQPTTAAVSQSVESLNALMSEKFKSIAIQFAERDTRTEQTSKDSKVAVDAALQAQKEAANATNSANTAAISKSEISVAKQIDSIMLLISSNSKAIDEKIDDLRTRTNSMVGHSKGLSDGWGYLVGIIGIVAAAFAIISHFSK